LIIVILLLPAICKAQLSSPGASAVRYTSYPSAPSVKDPVFIFCGASGSQKGLINATSPGGTAPFNFTWYKWSDVTKSFSVLIKTETGVNASAASDLDDGGYRVLISGGKDTILTGWVFIDKPFSSAALQNFTCDYVALNGKAAVDTFFYRNISNGQLVRLNNGVKFLWSSDPPSSIPYPDFLLNPQTFDPPLVDVTYNLQVSDSFGCQSQSSFFYKSIHVKADFTVDPDHGEAPLVVTFTDKSIRASKYKWEFGDSIASASIIRQTYSSVLANPEPHTYYIPGEYSVKLTVESDLHCIDSMRLDKKIVVDPSYLHIPNVFTPDGDGINDYFMIDAKSLRSLSVEVFSRSGLRVYSFYGEGKLITEWKGWDGNVNNTSAKASPGVYFYVMKATGWDNLGYSGKEYRGFVYLYR
jgi:gliding motility-associated-like protein